MSTSETLVSTNPATGETLGSLPITRVEDLTDIFARVGRAQQSWAQTPLKKRALYLTLVREALLNATDELASLISRENGKPLSEALFTEIHPAVQSITEVARRAPALLADHSISHTLMIHRRSVLNYWPLGTVAVIAPWNYPFFIPFIDIATALMAGNGVVFKPSEVTPLTGQRIQRLFEDAGFPEGLVQTVIGDGALGNALIRQRPAKVFFTGSVGTGKKVMAAAAENLVPVNLELGGKNALIVLSDADLDYASSLALWGGFANSGQVCAGTERILVHESVRDAFVGALKDKIAQLRQAPPGTAPTTDLGAITFSKQKDVYRTQLAEIREQGAELISGGTFSDDERFLRPTLVSGGNIERLSVWNDESFGPMVSVSTFRTIDEAVAKTNGVRYGLAAAVCTRNLTLGEEIARRLQVGTVTINEVIYTAGMGEMPWGGVKDSGFGRTRSQLGIMEFANVRHIDRPRSRLLVFKSWWWFPYTEHQYAVFRSMLNLYRRHWSDRFRAIPTFLFNLVQFLKKDRRL